MADNSPGFADGAVDEDDDFISDDQPVPYPSRFSGGRPTGNARILAQQDGRLGYDVNDAPDGLDNTIEMFRNAPNYRDLPGGPDEDEDLTEDGD